MKIEKKDILRNELYFDFHQYSINHLHKKFYLMTKFKDVDLVEKIFFYCINNRTLKDSNKFNSKGLYKRISFCNARILFIKDKNEFHTNFNHSSYCQKEKIYIFENIGDIN